MASDYKKRKNKRKEYIETKEIKEEIEIIDDEIVDVKEKKKLNKGEKIFIILNILVIILIIGYYAYRTIYYYNREHNENKDITLKEKITRLENITYQKDGLYVNNDYYYFKGVDVDNYLYYSGRLFRIISISDSIKVIEDKSIINLVYGLNEKYSNSIINKWLNKYLDSYKDYDIYLSESNWCDESVDVNNYNCNNKLSNSIGLISTKEYLDAGGVNSYLNDNSYFWTINYDSDNRGYFVNNKGEINNIVNTGDNYFSYGIKPVITLSTDLLYVSGDGTIDNPYVIEDGDSSLLKDKSVGNYVKYNNYLFRVMSVDDDGVSLIMEDNIEIEMKYHEILNYLNKEFIKKFNVDDLVKRKNITNIYNFDNKYNYEEEDSSSEYYITIPKIGDLFNNKNNCWLSSISDKKLNTYYIIDDNNMYFGDLDNSLHKVRPIIKLKGDILIKEGNGMKENPLIIGEL